MKSVEKCRKLRTNYINYKIFENFKFTSLNALRLIAWSIHVNHLSLPQPCVIFAVLRDYE